jgi:NCS2 family nucleobase:cation symporter-2
MCGGNGKVSLPFGSPQYVALGGSVIVYIIILEVFGSPFARNCSVAISLFLGFLTAAIFSYVPPEGGEHLSYISLERVAQAPSLTFLWARTFPLGVYFPALFPVMVCYVITTVESIGDITASCEASGLDTEGEVFDSRLQGGLLADGVNSFLSCLCTSMPNTTFSQNNGVISLTRCASRRAGYFCCVWMCIFGILAKLSALITSVPDCVLGGMVTFLFANITVSGIRILGQHDVSSPSLPVSPHSDIPIPIYPNISSKAPSKDEKLARRFTKNQGKTGTCRKFLHKRIFLSPAHASIDRLACMPRPSSIHSLHPEPLQCRDSIITCPAPHK